MVGEPYLSFLYLDLLGLQLHMAEEAARNFSLADPALLSILEPRSGYALWIACT